MSGGSKEEMVGYAVNLFRTEPTNRRSEFMTFDRDRPSIRLMSDDVE
jgi:hypothetical protein